MGHGVGAPGGTPDGGTGDSGIPRSGGWGRACRTQRKGARGPADPFQTLFPGEACMQGRCRGCSPRLGDLASLRAAWLGSRWGRVGSQPSPEPSSLSHLSSRAHTAFWHRCSSNPHCVPSGSFPGIRQSIGQTPTQRLSFLNAPPIAHIIPTGRPSSVPWLVPPPLGTGGAGEAGVLGRGLGAEP